MGGIFLLDRGVIVAEEIKNCGGHEKEWGCWDALFARYTVAQIYVFFTTKAETVKTKGKYFFNGETFTLLIPAQIWLVGPAQNIFWG